VSVRLIVYLALFACTGDVAGQVDISSATVPELHRALVSGSLTSVELTREYLHRIVAYDRAGPTLNAIVTINPHAMAEAAAADNELHRSGPRGLLHGIPVVVKDNIDVAGLPTTAGTLALVGNVPSDDSEVVRRLRSAGAVILAKTNMHELASGATTLSSVAGQTHNPYDLTRSPGGSSGGTAVAVAAGFAALGWGTDTCGSIRIPAANNALYALRPTHSRVFASGVLPLSRSHDVVAPLARSVTDLAVALDATVQGADGRRESSFLAALDAASAQGFRVGVLDEFFHGTDEDLATQWIQASILDRFLRSGDGATTIDLSDLSATPAYELHPDEVEPSRLTREALARMNDLGADTIPVEIPGLVSLVLGASLIEFEFRSDLNTYLGSSASPVRSLRDLLETGLVHPSLEEQLYAREMATESTDADRYRDALEQRQRLRQVLDSVFDELDLDVIAYPSVRRVPAVIGDVQRGSTCGLSSNTGWPAINVPVGFTEDGWPVGMELIGREGADQVLLSIAYAFEQATEGFEGPWSTPPLEGHEVPRARVVDMAPADEVPASLVVRADILLHPALNRLEYTLTLPATTVGTVLDLVLRVPRPGGGFRVVHLLNEAAAPEVTGSVTLSPALRRWLDAGEMTLHIVTDRLPDGLRVGHLSVRDR